MIVRYVNNRNINEKFEVLKSSYGMAMPKALRNQSVKTLNEWDCAADLP